MRTKISRAELRERLYRRRFLVPNLVTLGSMFCGFLAIIYASSMRYEKATIAIAFSILLDGLDGRVARRLNATSKFGGEFDSFADFVSFGIAPAMLMYHWCFKPLADEFGVFITFVFALCSASRLARFNITDTSLKSFVGLPTPGAAGMVAAVVNFSPAVDPSLTLCLFGALMMLALAYLMVSQIEFFSIKLLTVSGMHLWERVMIGALIALIWYNNRVGFVVLTGIYCLSGPVSFLSRRGKPSHPEIVSGEDRVVKMK